MNLSLVIKAVLFATFWPLPVSAGDWHDPEAKFDAHSRFTSKTLVTWVLADDVQKICEIESRKRGLGGFGYGVDACAFWASGHCTVVTSAKPTLHQLGHEIRHCFSGPFH